MNEDYPVNKEFPCNEKNHLDWCQQIIEKYPDKVEAYREDKTVLGFLVGQAMKLSGGSINPKDVYTTMADLLQQDNVHVPVIYFYSSRAEHGYMSNFARYPITMNDIVYKTSEHYYQSMKFVGTEWEMKVRDAASPMEAALLGRKRELPLRGDWDSVRDDIMRKIVEAKFRQHPELAKQLLQTGEAQLIEKTTDDLYWGCGDSSQGKNMLGIILMEVRSKLQEEQK